MQQISVTVALQTPVLSNTTPTASDEPACALVLDNGQMVQQWQHTVDTMAPGETFTHEARLHFFTDCSLRAVVRVEYSAPLSATNTTCGLHLKVRPYDTAQKEEINVPVLMCASPLVLFVVASRSTPLTWRPRALSVCILRSPPRSETRSME